MVLRWSIPHNISGHFDLARQRPNATRAVDRWTVRVAGLTWTSHPKVGDSKLVMNVLLHTTCTTAYLRNILGSYFLNFKPRFSCPCWEKSESSDTRAISSRRLSKSKLARMILLWNLFASATRRGTTSREARLAYVQAINRNGWELLVSWVLHGWRF